MKETNVTKKQKLERFKEKQLNRYISSAKHQFEQKILQSAYDQLEFKERELIDKLLNQSDEDGMIELSELKKDIPGSTFKKLDRKVLLEYYDRIMALSPSNILEFSTVGLSAVFESKSPIAYYTNNRA